MLMNFDGKSIKSECADMRNDSDTDVLVLGTGISGLASAYFAALNGLRTVVVGGTSGCRYMSGLLDFLDNLSGFTDDPCDGFSFLEKNHPLRRFNPEEVRQSMSSAMSFLSENGLKYESSGLKNSMFLTSSGTLKMSYGYPMTMKAGSEAIENGWPVLIVEFEGMKGFSSVQIAQGVSSFCKAIPVKIPFPGSVKGAEFIPEAAARSLDLPEARIKLAHALIPHIRNVKAVGLPPILGIYESDKVLRDLTDALGVKVFEIPGLIPSVPGLRFEEAMIRGLEKLGVVFFRQNRVSKLSFKNGRFTAEADLQSGIKTIRSKSLIMATGRFFSKGLVAGRNGVIEPLLGLPVFQPESRELWHSRQFFDPEGHALNRAGIITDEFLRPVCKKGLALMPNLYTAGTILAGQDWTREKCGASISFATAWKAVESLKMSLYAESAASEAKNKEETGEHHGHIIFSKAV